MRQCVHTGSGGQPAGHAEHQLGIDYGQRRDVVRIDANHLLHILLVGNHVIDRYLGSRTGRGWQGNHGNRFFLGRSHALKRNHIRKLRIVDDNTHRFRRIDRRTAADRNDKVRPGSLERVDTGLHISHGRVLFHVIEHLVRNAGSLQHIGHLCGNAEFYQILIGNHQSLFVAALSHLLGDHFTRSRAEIGCFVKNNSVYHDFMCLYVFKNLSRANNPIPTDSANDPGFPSRFRPVTPLSP